MTESTNLKESEARENLSVLGKLVVENLPEEPKSDIELIDHHEELIKNPQKPEEESQERRNEELEQPDEEPGGTEKPRKEDIFN